MNTMVGSKDKEIEVDVIVSNKGMDIIFGDENLDIVLGGEFLVETNFILSHFKITADELQDLMTDGYVHPEIYEAEHNDFLLLWDPKVFRDAYDFMNKSEREYDLVQSIKMQSE